MTFNHLDPAAAVILWGTLLLFLGILGRYCAKRCHQPGVLGELLIGILLGNIGYLFNIPFAVILRESSHVFAIVAAVFSGQSLPQAVPAIVHDATSAGLLLQALTMSNGIDWIKVAYVLDIFARYGVIFLLFVVGLETSVTELRHTGRASLQVAVIGVVAPIVIGLGLLMLMPVLSFKAALFVAATLSATSVGITARVLRELHQLRTSEARTILGAAMLDDILGLILLAIVSSIVVSGQINGWLIGRTVVAAIIFFIAALNVGPWLLRYLIRLLSFLEPWETKLLTTFLFVMLWAWLATIVQLATIIGAFVAGMIMHDDFFIAHDNTAPQRFSIKNVIVPFEAVFAPLFFILIGMQVKLETFRGWYMVLIISILVIAAVLGKLISGWGARKQDDRLMIGIGMLPRGEVGLIFASMGKTLGVINDQLFAAVVGMVVVTTIAAPIWLKARVSTKDKRHA